MSGRNKNAQRDPKQIDLCQVEQHIKYDNVHEADNHTLVALNET